ncbi:MAG: rod shape-determining protein MreC [Culturomica sp.]|nr:rod shape-determining protein MreC [Culturomica sp.]
MKNIIKLILRYHFTIIFVLLEFVAFSLIVEHNRYQRTIFSTYTSTLFFNLSSQIKEIKEYFGLQQENQRLVEENTILKNKIEILIGRLEEVPEWDSLPLAPNYYSYSGKAINATYNKTKNYITLNRGSDEGILQEMAVTSRDGVVGIIQNVSNHHSIVLPLINTNLRVSAKIRKNGYYGSLQWDGKDYRYSYLNDIPFHVNVEQGDTIVTSGFTSIFPEGEVIGFVETVDRETANFLTIKVALATDFRKLSDVYIIGHRRKEEKRELETVAYDQMQNNE